MAGNSSIRINNIQLKLIPDNTDQVVVWSNTTGNTVLVPIANLYVNTTLNITDLVIGDITTPANSTQNTTVGKIWSDGTYIYVGVANNQIKRITLSSF